ncbi:hypothetical protein FS749_006413 [Ceratobasidium sp. UAMH 11750]|nr:hypothetical protein FS749_006413 [Ceratobasidium sp. UAMH 11750]
MDSAPGADGDSDAGDDAGSSGSDSGLADDPGAVGEDPGHEHDLAPAYAHADMDLGDANPAPPLLDPIRQLLRNPAVAIDDWPDELPELEESDFDDESIAERPMASTGIPSTSNA